ncbi:hypothetical protein AKO1_007948 [Acrasis kona]|uniref:Mediator complex subunit 29 n=1 Tax=Acrasis kona TaxID=1008807 RepID=A0AAW2YSA3_9EUKA
MSGTQSYDAQLNKLRFTLSQHVQSLSQAITKEPQQGSGDTETKFAQVKVTYDEFQVACDQLMHQLINARRNLFEHAVYAHQTLEAKKTQTTGGQPSAPTNLTDEEMQSATIFLKDQANYTK